MKYKMDHFYGESGGTGNSQQLVDQVNAIDTRLTNLSNIAAKTNLANTFTTHQQINGYIKESAGLYKTGETQNVATIMNQSSKNADILFIQNSTGFRNYCNFRLRHRYGNQTNDQATTLFRIETRDTNAGVFIACENNKLAFINDTSISNVATPTQDKDAVNKVYVDSRTKPPWTLYKTQALNFKTTNLQWNLPDYFQSTGEYEFRIEIINGNFSYVVTTEFNITNLAGTYTSGLNYFQYGVSTTNAIQQLPDTAICFFYNNKWLRIAKYGENQPEANTTINLYGRKVR